MEDLTDAETAQLRLHLLRLLRKEQVPHHRGTIESVLTNCSPPCYGNLPASDCKGLKRTVNAAAEIIGSPLLASPLRPFFLKQRSGKGPHPSIPKSLSTSVRMKAPEPALPDCSTASSCKLREP